MINQWLRMTIRPLLGGLAFFGTFSPTWAVNPVKLSIPLAADRSVNSDFQISPDSSRVIYRADQTADNVFDLFSVPRAGGASTKLNDTMAGGGVQTDFQFSPDSSRVLYRGVDNGNVAFEIFSVPSAGGGLISPINGLLVTGGDVFSNFQFSPDSSRIFYNADKDTDEVLEIYSVLSGGGGVTKLNGTLVTGGDVGLFRVSPDSSRIVYRGDQNTNDVFEVYSVPSAGGGSTKLNGPLVTNGDVVDVQVSPDSSRVIYRADQNTDEVVEIYSVLSAGGVATKLNGTLVANGDVVDFQVSPNGSRVLYRADQSIDEVFEVFSVPSAGGAAIKLNPALVAGRSVSPISFSPDSSRVLYIGDQTTNDVNEIYTSSATSSSSVKINATLVAGGNVSQARYSPDGSRVVYTADGTTDGVLDLYSTSAIAATAVKLNHSLAADEYVDEWDVTPDGNRVLYSTVDGFLGAKRLFITPMLGGTPIQVNLPFTEGEGVLNFKISPDGRQVIYSGDLETANQYELFSQALSLNWTTSGGSWSSESNWDLGATPDEITEVTIAQPSVVMVPYSTSPRQANKVTVGGGAGKSVLELQDGAAITTLNGLELLNNGVLRGDGVVNIGAGLLLAEANSEIRVAGGQQLRFASTQSVSLGGKVEVIGTPENPAEIEFDSGASNEGGGLITGRNATLRFGDGLYNEGAVGISFGTSDVFGDIDNQGDIVVSGGAMATFYDDMNQDAILRVTRTFSTTSVAVFFGAFTGTGGSTGGGDVVFEGDLRPGNSPAVVTMQNNVALGASASLEIELGGEVQGSEYDQLNVVGDLLLSGTLDVTLINSFEPSAGDVFDILDWSSLSGTFDTLNLPDLGGLSWNTSQLYTTGTISVGLAGDFDFDGDVDGRDFLIWQRGGSPSVLSASDLGDWQTNYGAGALSAISTLNGDGTSPANAVPEPAMLGSFIFLAFLGGFFHRARSLSTYHSGG